MIVLILEGDTPISNVDGIRLGGQTPNMTTGVLEPDHQDSRVLTGVTQPNGDLRFTLVLAPVSAALLLCAGYLAH